MTTQSTVAAHDRSVRHPRQLHLRPDLIAKRVLDARRVKTLTLLARAVTQESLLKIELPSGDAIRMRKLVHRGAQRPVFKVPSVKLGRTVQCESLLEVDMAVLLDADPTVTLFAEQPARIHYDGDDGEQSHIPDYFVLRGDRPEFIEVKFKKDVDDVVHARTELMTRALGIAGAGYVLMTEEEIRCGGSVQNALMLLRRARHEVPHAQHLAVLERLRQRQNLTLGDFGWSVPHSTDAVAIARLIVAGIASVSRAGPRISAATRVVLGESKTAMGDAA